MQGVEDIVASYLADECSSEAARDALGELEPEAMREVLAMATAEEARGLEVLVMVLADSGYPGALPAMRRWLEHEDVEHVTIPAAFALAAYAEGRFDVDSLYESFDEELVGEIAAWWDSGAARVPSEAEWLAQRRDRKRRDTDEVPPPSPALSAEEQARLRPEVIALVEGLRALPPDVQHRLDLAAIRRALPIYAEYAPGDRVLEDALAATEHGDGSAWRQRVGEATSAANAAAGWSEAHHRYRVPLAKAAAEVAQGVLYALSPELRNRVGAMHGARNALEYAGRGFDAVRAELHWQLARVGLGRAGSVSQESPRPAPRASSSTRR